MQNNPNSKEGKISNHKDLKKMSIQDFYLEFLHPISLPFLYLIYMCNKFIEYNANNIFKAFENKYILIGANIYRSFDYLILRDNEKCTFPVILTRFYCNLPFDDFDELLSVKKRNSDDRSKRIEQLIPSFCIFAGNV